MLLRHAESVWNATGRWQGWADPPLSAAGEQQTRRAAARLASEEPFDLVVSSDLVRARRTAELLAEALDLAAPHLIEAAWREYDVGEWSGLTREQIESRWPGDIAKFAQGEISNPPGGESRPEFEARVIATSRQLAEKAASEGIGAMLIVVHGGVVRALARATGQTESGVGHLAGYRGWHAEGGLFLTKSVNLLDEEAIADSSEGAIAPSV